MKPFLKIILPITIVVTIFIAGSHQAFADGYFTITDYSISAVVSETNIYQVTETFDVQLTEKIHIITRTVPAVIHTKQQGADYTRHPVYIKDIQVEGCPWDVLSSETATQITMGSRNGPMEGKKHYTIRYTIDAGSDGILMFDEVLLNIIDPKLCSWIESADITVELPKPFDAECLAISPDYNGSASATDVNWHVHGNTITGRLDAPLTPLILWLKLPQGYFFSKFNYPQTDQMILTAIVLLTVAGILLFLLLGRGSRPARAVMEFNPPDGMTPAELAYIFDGHVRRHDIVCMLMHWINNKSIVIERDKTDAMLLHKRKELPGFAKEYEKELFKQIFKNGDTINKLCLKQCIAEARGSIVAMIEKDLFAESPLFSKASQAVRYCLSAVSALPVIAVLTLSFWRVEFGWPFALIAALLIGMLALWPAMSLAWMAERWRIYGPIFRARRLRKLVLVFGLFIMGFLAYEVLFSLPVLGVAAALSTLALSICAVFFSSRTHAGRERLSKALGFKDFITSVEQQKLMELVEKRPNIFFEILPYAFGLGVADKWVRHFSPPAEQSADWKKEYSQHLTLMAFSQIPKRNSLPVAHDILVSTINENVSKAITHGENVL